MDIPVLRTENGEIAILSLPAGKNEVEIEIIGNIRDLEAIAKASLLPVQSLVKLSRRGHRWICQIKRPSNICLQAAGLPLLWIAAPDYIEAPAEHDPLVRRLTPGMVHELGEVVLDEGETLWIPEGTVLRGCVRAKGISNVSIRGLGVIDGDMPGWPAGARICCLFQDCKNIHIEGVTVINPQFSCIVLARCQAVTIRGYHALSKLVSTDGVDIIGSQNVAIQDCLLAVNDDCVSIKAMKWDYSPADGTVEGRCDIKGIIVERCVLLKFGGGNVFEIGHETSCASISEIIFRDCDVIACHGNAVFSIHNCDCAVVEKVLYERIRVEHHFEKLFDLRCEASRFSDSGGIGIIQDVTFRDLQIKLNEYNFGYTASIMGGRDELHPISRIRFERVCMGDSNAKNLDELGIYHRHTEQIEVIPG
jgi:hypothetical protein